MAHVKSGKKKANPPVQEVTVSTSEPCQTVQQKRMVIGVCVALILACLAVYGQVVSFDFVNMDDNLYITENPEMQAGVTWDNFLRALNDKRAYVPYPHPITLYSHGLDCSLYGLHAGGHHLTSLITHILDSVLLFLVFARVTRRLWPSALVAALFAIHPMHVESVAWISERKDVNSMGFLVLCLWSYAWYRQHPNRSRYLVVVLLFLAGLLSKPTVVSLPFLLLLLDYWPLGQVDRTAPLGVMARKMVRLTWEKIPLFLISGLFCVAVFILEELVVKKLVFLNIDSVPFVERCANAVVVYVLYLAKTVWPSGLAAFYPYPPMRPLWQVAGAAAILAAITLFSFRQARRRPYLIVGWLWYVGTLVPVIGLVQAGNFSRSDRFTYIPLIGVFIMIAWGLADLVAAWRIPKRAVAAVSGVVIVALGVCATVQVGYWKNSETLFNRAIAVGQESSLAYNNLGQVYLDQKRFDKAKPLLMKAHELAPNNVNAINNLGMLALEQGRNDEAMEWLAKGLELDRSNVRAFNRLGKIALDQGDYARAKPLLEKALALAPVNVDVLNNLGLLALNQRQYEEADVYLKRALELLPKNINAFNNMGLLALNQAHYDEARTYLTKVLDLEPGNVNALNNLGVLAMNQNRSDEAEAWLKKALGFAPGNVNALNNLGLLAMGQGRHDEARDYLNKVLVLNPGHVSALYNLGVIAMDQKRYDEAKPFFRKVLDLKPGHANALNNLGWCLMNQGQYEEAQRHLRKALEIDPKFTKAMINLGDALANLGRQDEANIYIKRAAELNRSGTVSKE